MGGFSAHPIHQRSVLGGTIHAPAPGDHQGIAQRIDRRQRLSHQRQARGRHHRCRLGSHHIDRIGHAQTLLSRQVVGRSKDLQWAGNIQHLRIGEGEHMNDSWHVGVIRGRNGV